MEYLHLQIETIESMNEYLDKVIEGIDKIVEDCSCGNHGRAESSCQYLLEGLDWLAEAADLTNELQEKYQVYIESSKVRNTLNKLEKVLESDINGVSNIIIVELKPEMKLWKSKTHEILTKVA